MVLLCRPVRVFRRTEGDLRRRIEAEFREMPGLRLTLPQAARLFGVDQTQCEQQLLALVRKGLLVTDGQTFARADDGRLCA